ncbi:DUF2828 family protein [Chroococcidiopsis sp.]|uniref:DUF2828 family protein n=1 Tax=Chroococcidiopsis sp. TaxID=3088168 RepID=UPI003F417407
MVSKTSSNKLFAALESPIVSPPSYTVTENGAQTYASTGSALLDLFSRGAAMRKAPEAEIAGLLSASLRDNIPLTVVVLFYLRDVLEGQGERRFFRVALSYLVKHHPSILPMILDLVPLYGRWDDLFALEGTAFYPDVLKLFSEQLKDDLDILNTNPNGSISLAAKWSPSESSSPISHRRAAALRDYMQLTSRQYRKMLVRLRRQLKLVESSMCARRWDEINYSHVPSKAHVLYRKAFGRHSPERYAAYLAALKNPTRSAKDVKMNTKTLHPFDIVHKILYGQEQNATLEAAWENLPDWVQGDYSCLVVADTSGSMSGEPMSMAVALALYIAERNQGVWQDRFITFSSNPHLQSISGSTITARVTNLSRADWDTSTDLQAVFNLILKTAVQNKLDQADLPKTVVIVSDMQFNEATRHYSWEDDPATNLAAIRQQYAQAGYSCPSLVFWNVSARVQESPARFDESGVALVSGNSPTIFQQVVTGDFNPYSIMMQRISSPRYEIVREALEDVEIF